MGLFENSLGGRICVAGYYPFKRISFYQKSLQLKRLFDYLSKGSFAGYVKSHEKVRLWTYKGEGKNYMVLFNLTNDTHENLEIHISTCKKSAKIYDRHNTITCMELAIKDNTLTLKALSPYEVTLIEI